MASHFDRLRELLEIEHRAEAEQNKLELSNVPAAIREASGKTVARLTAEESGAAEGGQPMIAFSRESAGEDLSPFHAMNRGDLVCAETPGGQRFDGTLYEVEEFRAVVAMNGRLPEPWPRGRWSLHRMGSDATHRRMLRAVDDVFRAEKKPVARLRDVSFGKLKPGREKAAELQFFDKTLNGYQREAVSSALSASDFALVHGPPGTGKTTVLVEIIRQAVLRGERVLASAPSNVAVDNILERLLETGLRAVRLGHPARTMESLRHATLAFQVSEHPEAKTIRDLDRARERLLKQRSRRAERVQLGYDERHERQREIRELWREARALEKGIFREVLRGAQVVLATHGSLGRTFQGERFDLAVLDEASQAVEPLSWIPLLQAKRAVLAGDPRQLPPTLYSKEAAEGGLATTLFERLQGMLPEGLKTLLRVQYRMHERLMEFPSKEFYAGKLIADASAAGRLACGLRGAERTPLTESPLVFVDTAGAGFEEGWDEALQSRENVEEAGLAAKLIAELEAAGVPARSMAVMTPYVAQVRRLRSLGMDRDVEIGTVDGFQGREKEAVLLSLVRSNDRGEVGFLEDARRMNVALTRARRLLVVIGDSATLAGHPLYARFLDHVDSRGVRRSAWEWINA